jgi:hypothetical protein
MVRSQERIAVLMGCGANLEQVEREVIEPSGLDAERKAALWLYALAMADPHADEAAIYRSRSAGLAVALDG